MSVATTNFDHWQRAPSARLRRESWGGIAFDRAGGDLLEVDDEAFAVLVHLASARTLTGLRNLLGRQGHTVRPAELAKFVKGLVRRGFVRPVEAEAPALVSDLWAKRDETTGAPGLRAPLVAHWAVTYRCNLQCSFCYSESGPWRASGPEADVRLRLVRRLADWGILEVALGGGEPTILPDFPALLAAIREAGMVPNVTTNGTVHTAAGVRALAEHAGVVQLSADRADLLDEARGAGVFERLCDTARRLRAAGVRLGVNLLLTPENVRNVQRSLEALVDLGVQGVTFLRPKGAWAARQWPGFPTRCDLEPLAADLKRFLHTRPRLRLYVDTALREEWAQLGLFDDPEPEVLGCGGGQRHVAVTPEGDVYPCSHVRRPVYRMGNLLVDRFEQLWRAGQGERGRRRYRADCQAVRCPCRGPLRTS